MPDNNIKAVIEALLFASERPLTLEQIKTVLESLTTSEIRSLLERLRSEYEKSERGIRIIEIAGGFQMIAQPQLSAFLKKLYKGRLQERLSKPALETLAIIAYKQPVTRLEIESIRNVNVDGIVKSLKDLDLIRISGRKKTPGRPYVYGITKHFLEYFGLKSLEDLPKIDNFGVALATKEEADDSKEPTQEN